MTPKIRRPEELPPYQLPIETSSLIRGRKFLRSLLDTKKLTGYPMIGVMTGRRGLGKTVTIYSFEDKLSKQSHTGEYPVVRIRIPKKPSPRLVAWSLLARFNRKSTKTTYEILEDLLEVLLASGIQLVIADEGDYLNEDGFDTLRYIHDEAGISIAVFGLPALRDSVAENLKFESRVGLDRKFKPLGQEEVLNKLLPNLIFPRWQYDPDNDEDRKLGAYMWKSVRPSLRNLRTLLSRATHIAIAKGENRLIDQEIIEAALKMRDKSKQEQDENKNEATEDDEDESDEDEEEDPEMPELSEIELLSLKRREAKKQ